MHAFVGNMHVCFNSALAFFFLICGSQLRTILLDCTRESNPHSSQIMMPVKYKYCNMHEIAEAIAIDLVDTKHAYACITYTAELVFYRVIN
jgi:hypothetical protein